MFHFIPQTESRDFRESVKHLKEQFKQQFECFVGTADLYVFFYERGLKLLREHGVLTYISSNKYFRAAYGQKLRQFLASQSRIHQIIDFGDAPVFTAIAYPTIVVTEKTSPKGQRLRTLNWEMGKPIEQFELVVERDSFWMPHQELRADGWQFANDASLRLLERLRKTGTPLGEYVNGRFYRGILTGLNEAFVVDRATRDRLIAEHSSSAEVLKPFLRGRDIKRWKANNSDLWLLFIPWHFPLHEDPKIEGASQEAEKELKECYPAIYKHLFQYRSALAKRNVAETNIRYEWYALQRCAATYWQEFYRPKIVIPSLEKEVTYSIDLGGNFSNDKTSICCPSEPHYLLGLLNSKLLFWIIQQTAATRQGGFYEFKPMYVGKIPIVQAKNSIVIEVFVSYILYFYQQYQNLFSAQDKLMLEYFEQVINGLIYELYLPEDLHAHGFTFADPLQAENLPALDDIQGNKPEALSAIFQRLYAQDHPIRQNLFALDTLPVIRLIEGKDA